MERGADSSRKTRALALDLIYAQALETAADFL